MTSLDVMWHSRHSSLTSSDVITPLCVSRTIQYLHRCLKTIDPLCHLGNEWRHTFHTFHRISKVWSYRWFSTNKVHIKFRVCHFLGCDKGGRVPRQKMTKCDIGGRGSKVSIVWVPYFLNGPLMILLNTDFQINFDLSNTQHTNTK